MWTVALDISRYMLIQSLFTGIDHMHNVASVTKVTCYSRTVGGLVGGIEAIALVSWISRIWFQPFLKLYIAGDTYPWQVLSSIYTRLATTD